MVNVSTVVRGNTSSSGSIISNMILNNNNTSTTIKGWNGVLNGIQMVIEAGTKIASNDVSSVASRVSYHGSDLTTSIHDASISYAIKMIQQQHQLHQQQHQHQQQQYDHQHEQSMNNNMTFTPSSSSSSSILSTSSIISKQPQQQDILLTKQNFDNSMMNVNANEISQQHQQQSPTTMSLQMANNEAIVSTEIGIEPNNVIKIHNDTNTSIPTTATTITTITDSLDAATTTLPTDTSINHLPEGKAVPSTRFGRAIGFTNLGIGLVFGTAVEGLSRLVGIGREDGESTSSNSLLLNDANADRVASTLCRMRGAALKMGQMLSIQDESLLPPALSKALKQVRHGAEAMPQYQLQKQMEIQLGNNWKDMFLSFDMLPFAAASIGQVHKAIIIHPITQQQQDVVVKVQYPGVGQSIESDLRNLSMLVSLTGLSPKGLFIENVIRVGMNELIVECNYRREMKYQQLIKELVSADPVLQANGFVVPNVYPEYTSNEVITSEYCRGGTIDKVATLNQNERNRIGRTIMYLTMQELFVWRIMQVRTYFVDFFT
jgi:ABC1 atypical kinase-like domain